MRRRSRSLVVACWSPTCWTDLLRRRRPAREGFDLVVTGHSHRYRETREDGVLFLNPGAAGAARFGLPRSVAIVELDAEGITVAKVELT